MYFGPDGFFDVGAYFLLDDIIFLFYSLNSCHAFLVELIEASFSAEQSSS